MTTGAFTLRRMEMNFVIIRTIQFKHTIINIDKNGLELAKARKAARKKEQNEFNELKSEVKELKELILQLSKSMNDK